MDITQEIVARQTEELQSIPVAAITSIIYQRGFSGVKYFELRKMIFKELQRIDSEKKKLIPH